MPKKKPGSPQSRANHYPHSNVAIAPPGSLFTLADRTGKAEWEQYRV